MTSSILIQVMITCLLGASSPGPSLVLVSKNAISNGKFSGTLTGFGHGLGIFIYAFISILGLGLIHSISSKIIDFITIILVVYLLYLAFKIFNEKKTEEEKISKKILLKNFFDGFLIFFFNPKITIFFFAIFSQFITTELSLFDKFYLASIASIIDFFWYTFVSIIVGNSTIRGLLNKGTFLNKISSIIFVIISIFILVKIFNF